YNDGFSGKINPIFSTSNYHKSIFQKSPHYDNKAELPVFNLYKMHGSVTWKSDANQIAFDGQLQLIQEISKIKIKKKLIEELWNGDKLKSVSFLLGEAGKLEEDESFTEF